MKVLPRPKIVKKSQKRWARYINIYLTILRVWLANKIPVLTNDSIDLHRLEMCIFSG